MDFRALANEAITVEVNDSAVTLRIPPLDARRRCIDILMKLADADEADRALAWDRMSVIALSNTVVGSEDVTEDEWERAIVNGRVKGLKGLTELSHAALTLCGVNLPMPGQAEDNIETADETMGNSPT